MSLASGGISEQPAAGAPELPRTITGCPARTWQHCLKDWVGLPPVQDYHTAVEGALHGDGFVRLLMDQHAQDGAEQGAERAAQSAVRKLEIKVGALPCSHWRCDTRLSVGHCKAPFAAAGAHIAVHCLSFLGAQSAVGELGVKSVGQGSGAQTLTFE